MNAEEEVPGKFHLIGICFAFSSQFHLGRQRWVDYAQVCR